MATAVWVPVPGTTYLRDTPRGKHLFVVLHGPAVLDGYGQTPKILSVSITSIKPNVPHDPACVLKLGDHPFVDHDSFAYYRAPAIDTLGELQEMHETMGCQPNQDCSAALLHRLRISICQSKLAKREFKDFLGCV